MCLLEMIHQLRIPVTCLLQPDVHHRDEKSCFFTGVCMKVDCHCFGGYEDLAENDDSGLFQKDHHKFAVFKSPVLGDLPELQLLFLFHGCTHLAPRGVTTPGPAATAS